MITGWVLAGGMSSRMGREKALLTVRGGLLIEQVLQRLQPQVDRLRVIANADNISSLRARLDGLPQGAIVTDLVAARGPLMGIYTGLLATETPLNLFIPCDMPWIERELIERLLAACREGITIVASLHPTEGLQPFPLVCHVSACRAVGALLDRQERSLHVLCVEPEAKLLRIEEPALWRSFTNVNTLADYAQLNDESTLTPRS